MYTIYIFCLLFIKIELARFRKNYYYVLFKYRLEVYFRIPGFFKKNKSPQREGYIVYTGYRGYHDCLFVFSIAKLVILALDKEEHLQTKD